VTEYILTKLAVVVKDYLFYFEKKFNIFSHAGISTSGNYYYSIIGGKMQGDGDQENIIIILIIFA